jgi:HSP20 family protein
MFDPEGRWPGNLDQLQREMERYLQHLSQKKPHAVMFSRQTWQPAIDIYESDAAVIALVDLAGVKQDEIELVVGRTSLTVRGERRDSDNMTDRRVTCMEIPYGPFERVVPLPAAINPDAVSATYEAGFLRVTMPKAGHTGPRRVTVARG